MSTKAKSTMVTNGRAVVVTTENRGVFFGYVRDESKAPAQITLEKVRNCVYWPMQVLLRSFDRGRRIRRPS